MSGYSQKPLHQKLGIKEGHTVGIINAPPGFDRTLGDLPGGADIHDRLEPADILVVFAREASVLEPLFHQGMAQIPANGAIWVAWPKKSSTVESDLDEDRLRRLFLPTGMVDNKVCAIDETWSGLRFVVRKENRTDW